MIQVAFGSVPKDGGTFTFYRNQRPALVEHGINLRCVTIGKAEAGLCEESFLDEGCVLLAEAEAGVKRQARRFVEWCEEEGVNIVIAVNSKAMLSALPHLPERIRVVARCANAFDHGYRITMAGRERLAQIIALTPRLERDLVTDYGADPAMIRLIPNGIDPRRFDSAMARGRGTGERLELGFLGRLEHTQKGVLHLPKIVKSLRSRGVPFRLRIAGKGVHREALERAMRDELAEGVVEFVGSLGPAEVPEFLKSVDVYLFPSHFEGCPNALLEAMMAGCVPVAWVIEGITDFLMKDGQTGGLVPMGDCEAFAAKIADLAAAPERIGAMSRRVAAAARERFSTERAAKAYAAVMQDVMAEEPPRWEPRAWNEFRVDPAFEPGWKDLVPVPLRNAVKKVMHFAGIQWRSK